jgi:hypothetical protein
LHPPSPFNPFDPSRILSLVWHSLSSFALRTRAYSSPSGSCSVWVGATCSCDLPVAHRGLRGAAPLPAWAPAVSQLAAALHSPRAAATRTGGAAEPHGAALAEARGRRLCRVDAGHADGHAGDAAVEARQHRGAALAVLVLELVLELVRSAFFLGPTRFAGSGVGAACSLRSLRCLLSHSQGCLRRTESSRSSAFPEEADAAVQLPARRVPCAR